MAIPQSIPTVPSQPTTEYYGVQQLYLLHQFQTASEYDAATGQSAVAFDPSRRPKRWFDSTIDLSDPEADVQYTVIRSPNPNVPFTAQTVTMPAWEASTVNFPPSSGPVERPEREVPIRPLLSNERIVITPFGPSIQRTDLAIGPSATSWTDADRTLLHAIGKALNVPGS